MSPHPDPAPAVPSNEMLARYSVGAETPGASLLIAAHLALCPASRARARAYADCAGALLADTPPAAMAPDALDRALAALALPEPATAPAPTGPLPAPVARAVGINFDQIPWRRRLPGVAEHDLAGFAPERVSLLRARPGSWLPRHTHRGRELTLVLAGTLQDGARTYHPGDIAQNAEADDHKPRIIGEGLCYCLIVLDGGLRYTGTFTRALNLLGD